MGFNPNLLRCCTALVVICCLQFEGDTQTVPSEKGYAGYVVFRNIGYNNITFLLLKPKSGTNSWILPEGAIKSGESTLQAANRMLELITGYTEDDFVDIALKDRPFRPDKSRTYLIAYITASEKPIKLSSEYEDFKWLYLAEACKHADKLGQKLISEANTFLVNSGYYLEDA